MKHILQFETMIECSVEALFAFHADTHNLPRITPPGTTVTIIHLEEELKEGNQAILDIKKGLLSFRWELIFERVDYPNLIVDVATKSPFRLFRHEHHFITVDDTHTMLSDRIEFSLPLSILNTPIVWFVKRDMQKMFAYRHAQTKQLLEKL